MTISLVIDTTGTITKKDIVGYEDLSKTIGGLIESVPANPQVTIWCNEEGKLLNLDFNPTATDLWEVFDIFGCITAGDFLVGPIVIQGPLDDEGECTDIPEWILQRLGLTEELPFDGKTLCPTCKGHGGTWNGVTDYVECEDCDGWGHTYE